MPPVGQASFSASRHRCLVSMNHHHSWLPSSRKWALQRTGVHGHYTNYCLKVWLQGAYLETGTHLPHVSERTQSHSGWHQPSGAMNKTQDKEYFSHSHTNLHLPHHVITAGFYGTMIPLWSMRSLLLRVPNRQQSSTANRRTLTFLQKHRRGVRRQSQLLRLLNICIIQTRPSLTLQDKRTPNPAITVPPFLHSFALFTKASPAVLG